MKTYGTWTMNNWVIELKEDMNIMTQETCYTVKYKSPINQKDSKSFHYFTDAHAFYNEMVVKSINNVKAY